MARPRGSDRVKPGRKAPNSPAVRTPGWNFERKARERGFRLIAGVDEAGRGALFGPVFAAAVILAEERPIRGLNDSKLLPAERREVLAGRIRERAVAWAVGAADAQEIDAINILEASKLAMWRAISQLQPQPDFLLIDFVQIETSIGQEGIVRGDGRSRSIAAASILAKVERDACLRHWDQVYPSFGFSSNKGYSAPRHADALREFGPTAQHRFSFQPVRDACPWMVWPGYRGLAQVDLFTSVGDNHPVVDSTVDECRPLGWGEAAYA
ncbi:MAG: ribonuclease HII [Bryobacteraceae bacterium]